jgi:hypothetical protein
LESIGFAWKIESEVLKARSRKDEVWESVFHRLVVYKEEHGDCNVPEDYNDGGWPHLGMWVGRQRSNYIQFSKTSGNSGSMSQERIDRLNSIVFVWELGRKHQHDAAWMAQFEDYKAFQQKYNTTKAKILARGSDDPITKVGTWLQTQIVGYNRFMGNKTLAITEEKIKLLNSTGFSWSLKSENHYEKWVHMYFKLYIYHYQHNSTSVSEADGHNSMFVKWTRQQKEDYKNGTLTKLQIDLLNELDFDWNLDPPPTWDDMYEELVQYRIKHGSTLINGYINKELSRWTKQQMKDYRKGRLDVDKIKKLEMLVFDWNPKDSAFNAMVDRLAIFKKKYNSTLVPKAFDEDPPLGNFVFSQRNIYGKNLSNVDNENIDNDLLWSIAYDLESTVIPADTHFARMKRLTDLEFVWDVLESKWMEMYQRLVGYKEVHNTTLSVAGNPQDQDLKTWATYQRSHQDRGKLSARRIALLNDIDFVWDPLETNWNEMFDRLVEYKRENNGSTMVPEGYKEDPELANWVNTQRRVKKQKGLSPERSDRLDSIGFVWAFR